MRQGQSVLLAMSERTCSRLKRVDGSISLLFAIKTSEWTMRGRSICWANSHTGISSALRWKLEHFFPLTDRKTHGGYFAGISASCGRKMIKLQACARRRIFSWKVLKRARGKVLFPTFTSDIPRTIAWQDINLGYCNSYAAYRPHRNGAKNSQAIPSWNAVWKSKLIHFVLGFLSISITTVWQIPAEFLLCRFLGISQRISE
jgi:hypothetical protein